MRGNLDVETLLRIILVLIALWLVLAIVTRTLDLVWSLFGLFPFTNLIGLVIALIIVLWLLDYL